MKSIRGNGSSSAILLVGMLVVAGCSNAKVAPEKSSSDVQTSRGGEATASSIGATYIPKTLEDAFAELDRILSAEVREEMRAGPEEDMIEYHHGLGTWMRNEWGLWADSRLSAYFESLGIHHPDDMSGIILDSYWRRLHGLDLGLDAQVSRYREYWENAREPEDTSCPKDRSTLVIEVELHDDLPDGKVRIRHVGSCEQGHTLVYERGKSWREPTEDEWPRIRGDEGGTVRTIGMWKD